MGMGEFASTASNLGGLFTKIHSFVIPLNRFLRILLFLVVRMSIHDRTSLGRFVGGLNVAAAGSLAVFRRSRWGCGSRARIITLNGNGPKASELGYDIRGIVVRDHSLESLDPLHDNLNFTTERFWQRVFLRLLPTFGHRLFVLSLLLQAVAANASGSGPS